MLRNYLKIALRTLRTQKLYSVVNLAGLAVGLAVCLAIALWVRHEMSYDRFEANADRLYRVTRTDTTEGEASTSTSHPAPLGTVLAAELPDVERAVRFSKSSDPDLVQRGEKRFYESGILYADSSFFEVFSFDLARGNPQTALDAPYTVVLSRSMAQKYFGNENPLGQTLSIGEADQPFEVTGVAEDVPLASSIQYDFIGSFQTKYAEQHRMMAEMNGGWNMAGFPTYLLLRPGAQATAVEAKLPGVLDRAAQADYFIDGRFALEPITGVHLHSPAGNQLGPSSDARYVWIFGAIALLVLGVACVNYMNLATARAARRAKEVGVRKTVGATRGQLARQFLGESVLMGLAAALLALLAVRLALPAFSWLAGVHLEAGALLEPAFLLGLGGAVGAVSLLAGSYPALVLSRFRAAEVVRGHAHGRSGARFRQALVVFQFAVSVALLAGAAVVWSQLGYVQTERLGLDEEHLLILPNRDAISGDEAGAFKAELRRLAGVKAVAAGSAVPTEGDMRFSTAPGGHTDSEGPTMTNYRIDANYLKTLGIELAAGRPFSQARGTDPDSALILNEAAVREIGWQHPVGKRLSYGGQDPRTVVGVVKDFHYESFHNEIKPLFMTPITRGWENQFFAVRVRAGNLPRLFSSIGETWDSFASGRPLDYFFLEGAFDRLYESERRVARLFTVFFVLTAFVACLGLFGLAAYTVEGRTQEIGIRKALGASAWSIVALLSKGFALLVVLSLALGVPLAWLGARRWLRGFAYHIDLGAGPFLLSGLAVLAVALLTVGYQALRAARTNPAQALRDE